MPCGVVVVVVVVSVVPRHVKNTTTAGGTLDLAIGTLLGALDTTVERFTVLAVHLTKNSVHNLGETWRAIPTQFASRYCLRKVRADKNNYI